MREHSDYISRETLAVTVDFAVDADVNGDGTVSIDGQPLRIAVARVAG